MLSLQLATIDRIPTPRLWMLTFAALVALSLLAIAVDERRLGTGGCAISTARLAREPGWPRQAWC